MQSNETPPAVVPLLIVRGVASAVDFYVAAFGAHERARTVDRRSGAPNHVDLAIGDTALSLTEEAPAYASVAPPSLGGSPVVLMLSVERVDDCFERACRLGAAVVFPVIEFCGERMGRLRDPFGHLWIVSERIEELSPEEKQRRLDAWTPPTDLVAARGDEHHEATKRGRGRARG